MIARALEWLWWSPARRWLEPLLRRVCTGRETILAGPLRGVRFRGGLAHVLGIYEPAVQRALAALVSPGDCVLDIGGHVGFVALLASRLVGPSGQVVVFEPERRNRERLESNLSDNRWARARISRLAVGETPGLASFASGLGPQSRLATDSESSEQIEVTNLDEFVRHENLAPAVVKIDVEGAEAQVLAGARCLLSEMRPGLLIEVHGPDEEKAVRRILGEYAYEIRVLPEPRWKMAIHPRHLMGVPPRPPSSPC